MDVYQRALAFVLAREGGFVDNPNDHGGATNQGVTQRVYDGWRQVQGLPLQTVRDISSTEVEDIYRHLYWHPAHCDSLIDPVAICHMDWSVNHGVNGAMHTLQEAAGVTADGIWGPQTQEAVQNAIGLPARYLELRAAWYRDDAEQNPSQAVFLDGWLQRIADLKAYIVQTP